MSTDCTYDNQSVVILIESQWNLNEDVRREQSRSRAILIESQWNLNHTYIYIVPSSVAEY